jgi:uncharacterized protein YggT (Ycf19 family)
MQFTTWDTLFNIIILLFWYRVWSTDARATALNPYLASLHRLSNAVLGFLKPALFFLSERMVAVAAVVFLLVLRAFAAPREAFNPTQFYDGWRLDMNIEKHLPGADSINAFLLFSVLSFALFLFKLWGLSLIYVRRDTYVHSENTTDTFYHLSRPFSRARYEWRPGILVVVGILLALVLHFVGPTLFRHSEHKLAILPNHGAIDGMLVLRCAVTALAAWVGALSVLIQLVIVFIIGSWVGMFTGHQGVIVFCREWMDLLMGPLRKYPMRIGMIDLSPLVFIVGVHIVQLFLLNILWNSYNRLL